MSLSRGWKGSYLPCSIRNTFEPRGRGDEILFLQLAHSTHRSAALEMLPLPPRVVRAGASRHRTRRNLCDFPVSSPSIDDLYCSIPIYKHHRPAGQPCKKNVWGGLNFFGNFILSTYLLLKILIFFCHF